MRDRKPAVFRNLATGRAGAVSVLAVAKARLSPDGFRACCAGLGGPTRPRDGQDLVVVPGPGRTTEKR
jgi:hypothetical protein